MAEGGSSRLRRAVRKHALPLGLLGVILLLLLAPTIFFGRVLSPNDVYYIHDPWRTLRTVDVQNPLLSDPPSSWMPLWSLVRNDPDAFHWNRWVAGGIPGYGSAAAAVLSPVILIPILAVPLLFSYTAVILVKLWIAFALAYGWLREERLGKGGAAIGALAFSTAGIYSIWWLWQATNATVLYPAVFWIVARAFAGKRTPAWALVLVALSLALSGFPAATLYAFWAGLLYAGWLAFRTRRVPWREAGRAVAAVALALALAAPSLASFAWFLGRTGYLETRREVAGAQLGAYPADHLASFVDPFRLGDPAQRLWIGDPRLGGSNNFAESTIYLGLIPLVLALAGAVRPHRGRWFWVGLAVLVGLLIFGVSGELSRLAGSLPGIRYSLLSRLRFLLPASAAFLAASAAGWAFAMLRRRRPRAARIALSVTGVLVAFDLGLFAVRYHPYLPPAIAEIPVTPTIEMLRRQDGPFRIAPMFDYLWPNSAELMRVEDVRSHFGSELRWRALISRFAPGSFGGMGTLIQFNSLTFDFTDPLISALNVRFLIEQPTIDILRWRITETSRMSEPVDGRLYLWPGMELRRQIAIVDGMKAIDLNLESIVSRRAGASFELELIRPETGEAVWKRVLGAREAAQYPKIYAPVTAAAAGNLLVLKLRARGATAAMPRGESGELVYGIVTSPVILHSILPEGRVFENLDARPRFWPVWNLRRASFDEMIADRGIDFRSEAVLTGGGAEGFEEELSRVTPAARRARVRILEWTGSSAVVEAEASVPFFLASSEKRTPELEMTVDGDRVSPVEVDGLFAGVALSAGSHRIELRRRVGRGWWPASAAGALLAAGWIVTEAVRSRRSRRPGAARRRRSTGSRGG